MDRDTLLLQAQQARLWQVGPSALTCSGACEEQAGWGGPGVVQRWVGAPRAHPAQHRQVPLALLHAAVGLR